MNPLARLVDIVCQLMMRLSGLMIVAMMAIVLIDVITRALFRLTDGRLDFTFLGGIELVSFALLFAILYALPWCVDRSQVVVDLFTEQLSERKKTALEMLCFAGYTLLGTGMSIRFWHAVGSAHMSGETTQDLMLPMSYIYAATLFGTVMLALRSLMVSIDRGAKVMGIKS
ncbi:TRAP transporter small permease [Marinobacterium marinum]|uniref:TRAP transporter small permease protein n=1 Tax=Marinobacterium marinum TaxID=2756129 RepID=A0A7W1WWQ1_9GAMM|nr:TRAP transporter small permease subunit [Marinobacterium marinum]MBA4501586.1 TRAP transporter small permease [Marinobacterium marinum]